jgi:hypothetical protein
MNSSLKWYILAILAVTGGTIAGYLYYPWANMDGIYIYIGLVSIMSLLSYMDYRLKKRTNNEVQ